MNVGSTYKLLEKAQAARQRDWGDVELACLKKEKQFARFASTWWCGTFATVFHDARTALVGHENTWRWMVCGYKGL